MIARFGHRPRLTAALVLATIVLAVVVTLLIIPAPPTVPVPSGGVGDNPPVIGAGCEHYGDGWSNYGHDRIDHTPPRRAAAQAPPYAVDRHAEVVAAYTD